jgi:hypothetical protein
MREIANHGSRQPKEHASGPKDPTDPGVFFTGVEIPARQSCRAQLKPISSGFLCVRPEK